MRFQSVFAQFLQQRWSLILFCGLFAFGEARAVTFQISDHTTDPGSSITVPVTVSGFSGVTSFQFTLAWDSEVLQYVDNGGYGLAFLRGGSFGKTRVSQGKLTVGWDDEELEGKALGDGTTLFTVTFNAVGGNGSSSSLSFSDDPTQREVTVDFSVVGFNSSAGTIQVGTIQTGDPPSISSQPVSQTATVGDNINFAVGLNGTEPLSYEWRRNGVGIAGETSGELTLNNVQLESAGDFTLVVSNEYGSVTSAVATLVVNVVFVPQAPVITVQPASQKVTAGANVTFMAQANGTPPLSYQWQKDGLLISGETASTLTLNNTQLSASGSYSVTVSNSEGSVVSEVAVLTVNPAIVVQPPVIQTQPLSRGVTEGIQWTFFVQANGTVPLSYQWLKDGLSIAGKTGAALSFNNVQLGDAGSYSVVVSNSAGIVTSERATLTVTPAPVVEVPAITAQPLSQTTVAGGRITFAAAASGTSPFNYQWYRNGVEIAGETDAILVLNNVLVTDSGDYNLRVSNTAGEVTSAAAVLTVNEASSDEAPKITVQPVSQIVDAGDSVRFSVLATGIAPLQYEWRRDDEPIDGATGGLLILRNARLSDSGQYTVFVSNAHGEVKSESVELIVNPSEGRELPLIATQPASVGTVAGATVVFTVLAQGQGPFSYQWEKDGVFLEGKDSAILSLIDVETADAGIYSVLVSNEQGTVSSSDATLSVSADLDGGQGGPIFKMHPLDKVVTEGERVTFSVEIEGASPFS